MHVLVFNMKMDVDDPVLAFATGWVNELAGLVDRVTVVTMEAGRVEVADNVRVYSVGKERGFPEWKRAINLWRIAARVVRQDRPDVCFTHMIAVFAVLFAPMARRHGIPIVLWYAHGAVPPLLHVAHALAERCLTSTPKGFRLESEKLHVIGQGVDTELFRPRPGGGRDDGTIVAVGRIAPVKRLAEAIEALALVRASGHDARLILIGAPAVPADYAYEQLLRTRTTDLGLADHVEFRGALPYREMPDVYRYAEVALNLSLHGPFDKALLEGVAAGLTPVSANESFTVLARREGVAELATGDTPEDVARALGHALGLPSDTKRAIRERLRTVVVNENSLHRIATVIASHLRDAAGSSLPANAQLQRSSEPTARANA